MIKQKQRVSPDPIAKRGHGIYMRQIRRRLAGEKKGRVVALDVRTADYEVADDVITAAAKLRLRRPKAEIWLERVGYRTLRRFGIWHAEGKE